MPRIAVLFLLLLGACASVTTGTTQTIAIESEPPGAACALQRAGDVIARVAQTPGEASVSRTSIPIEVDCTLADHLPGRTTLPSGIQGMTFGNVLIGGVIGVVVDAASGAIHSYPDRARVDLSPERFASADARDAYFEARRARLQAALQAVQSRYADACSGGDRGPTAGRCAEEMESALAQAERALQRVEAERQAARIAPDAPQDAPVAPPTAIAQAPETVEPTPPAPVESSPAEPAEPAVSAAPPSAKPVEAPVEAPATAPQPAPQIEAAALQPATPTAQTPAAKAPVGERWRLRLTVKTPIVSRSWCRPNESGESVFTVVDDRADFRLRSDNASTASVRARFGEEDGPAIRITFRGQSSPRPFSFRMPQPSGAGAAVERTILYTHSYTPCEYRIALEKLPGPPEEVAPAATVATTAPPAEKPGAPSEQADAVAAYEARLAELEAMLTAMRSELIRLKAADGGDPSAVTQ